MSGGAESLFLRSDVREKETSRKKKRYVSIFLLQFSCNHHHMDGKTLHPMNEGGLDFSFDKTVSYLIFRSYLS